MASPESEEQPRSMVTTTGYNWYSDATTNNNANSSIQTHLVMNQLQSFEPNSEIYSLASGMEMIGLFPPKNPVMSMNSQVENLNIHQGYFQIRNSKYLGPAQELLNEFCNLGLKKNDHSSKVKPHKANQWQDHANASSSSKLQPLESFDVLELQKRKVKLLQMLEEVDRRYKNYCNQMKAVVSTFEAVAGNGAANVYLALASRAMSRHFRCLRDGIIEQIKAIKKVTGEKDYVSPGSTRGETPRLRVLDQTLRQQKALQQMDMMESHPWRPQRGLPERSVSVLRAWLFEHFLHPYPSDVDKHILARQTGLSRSQVSNWFINARVRLWKPMVEEMYLEENKEQQNLGSPNRSKAFDDINGINYPHTHIEDEKPNLLRLDSECISSIINNPEKNDHQQAHENLQTLFNHGFERTADSFGAIELDFSSYNHNSIGDASHGNEIVRHKYYSENSKNIGGGGVSLTLGLQQHGGIHDMGLPFSHGSQGSLFYPRDHFDDNCQQVQYSLLDSENQNLPYRKLMGAQLLHDLAG